MTVLRVSSGLTDACSGRELLLFSSVPLSLRIWLLCLAISISGFAKDIRLRNELIQTPDKPAAGTMRAQAVENPADGLFLIQFDAPITDSQRAQLTYLNVELIQAVPEDAFVARLNGVRLGAVRSLDFVRWIGPMRAEHKIQAKIADLKEKRMVSFLAAPNARPLELAFLRKRVPGILSGPKTFAGTILHGKVDAAQLKDLANSPAVLWIEAAPQPKLFDEVAAEIVGGEAAGPRNYVQDLGFDGSGVTVAVADSGLMEGTVDNMHPDLAGRVDGFFFYGHLTDAADEHSHGTHVAGIVADNGASGEADEEGFLYGLGIAPKAHIVAQRMFDGVGNYEAPDSYELLTRNAVQAGAVVGSNSWGDDTQGRYDLSAMEFDALVRDADAQTPGDQPYILEFSAGNAGPAERTIGSPAVGKNVIATGAAQNNRVEFLIYEEGQEAMADFSSRGPCEDGRIKPDVVAPGTWISSLQSSAASDENAWLPISSLYQYQGGTSQAGPHTSGAAAVFVQYYRETHGGLTPSPALVKAALINSAADMDPEGGTAPIPNNDEGWGRIDLAELIGSDRVFEFVDQTNLLSQNQVFEKHIFVADDSLPLRITLTYTDVPGTPLTIPALVNDLDLEVIAPDGSLYAGNQMADGESAPEPATRDALNNVEGVYLKFPLSGEYVVRVRATRVPQDARRDTAATDQDFALVISGALPDAGHAAISMDRRAYTAPGVINLKLIDFDLAGQPGVNIALSSTTETTPLTVHLAPSGTTGVFTGAVTTARGPAVADSILQISHGDDIIARYQDASPQESVVAIRRADLNPPVITNVAATNRFGNERISWTTDEPATSIVRFGTNGNLNLSVTNLAAVTDHAILLTNLVVDATYKFIVISFDEAGNGATNNNGGQGYTFVAPRAATVLLVDAYKIIDSSIDDTPPIPVTEYTDALDQTGVSYEVWDANTDGSPQLSNLLPYRVVIWRVNDSLWDDGSGISTLSPAQQTMIESYLKRDGAFFMASMEILSRLGAVPFRTNVFQVDEFTTKADPFSSGPEFNEDHTMAVLEGLPSDSIGAGVEVEMDYSPFPAVEFFDLGPDFTDTFTATTNAAPIFIDQATGETTGIRWPRDPKTPGRLVFCSFPLGGVPMQGTPPNNRVNILRNILSYLAPGVNGLGTISLDHAAYTIPDRMQIEVADSDLAGAVKTSIKVFSTTVPAGVAIDVFETARKGVFQGAVTLIKAAAVAKPGELRVTDGDEVWAEYFDASANSVVKASGEIDASNPVITGTKATPDYQYAAITWTTDEPTDALVQYGESAFLGRTVYRSAMELDHQLVINNLKADQDYFYQVVSRDVAGNTTVDDNHGQLYKFHTLTPKMPPWTDDMEGATTNWTVETSEDSELHWELGTPANGLHDAGHSGTKAWSTNPRGEMASYAETALVSPAFLLTGGNKAKVTFWHSYDFTVDSTFESASLQLITNALAGPVVLAQYSDLAADWEQVEVDLTPYIGKVVQLVWYYQLLDFEEATDPHIGWMVDDVSVTVETDQRGTLIASANLSQGSYTIAGPSPGAGEGTTYTNSAAVSGNYTITYGAVPYYITPPSETKTLATGSTIVFAGKYEINDTNHNGISDEWEQQYFGSVDASRSGGIDSDGDRFNDYSEFMAGTLPNDPTSKLTFEDPVRLGDGRLQLSWSTMAKRSYRIFGSTNGSTWAPYTDWIRATGPRTTQTLPSLSPARAYLFRIEVKP